MSQENVEIVRNAFEQFIATGEPVWELTDPDVVVADHDIMDGEDYRGHQGVKRWLADWAAAWSAFSMEPEEYLDAGESVVVVLQMRATGASSGVEVTRQDAIVFRLRDGTMSRLDYYNSREQAVKAVGLEKWAISQANVGIVRRAIEAFNQRDFDMALRDVAPDGIVDMSHSRGPDAGVYVGHDAVRRFWTDMTEPFEQHMMVPDEFIPHGEHVVVPMRARMTGRGGIEVEAKTATVVALRAGRMVRWTMYQDRAEALKAVGLEE